MEDGQHMAIILKGMEIKCCAVQYRKKKQREERSGGADTGEKLNSSSTFESKERHKKMHARTPWRMFLHCIKSWEWYSYVCVGHSRPLYLQSFVHIPSTFPGLVTKYKHIVYSLFPLEIPSHPGKIQLTFIKSSAHCLVILVPSKSCYVVKNWATCFLLKQNIVSHLERHTMFKCLHLEGQTNRSDGAANLRPIWY